LAPSQVQAALQTVSPKVMTKGKTTQKLSDKPLQPSASASETSLDAAFSYKPKVKPTLPKPAKKKSPEEEKKLLDKIVQKSVELGRK
jgi:hypothetical protein